MSGDKPDKPDPFAPLPLATLPPVRRRGEGESGPTPTPTTSVAPSGRTRAPSSGGLSPTAFVPQPPTPSGAIDQAWDAAPSGGQPDTSASPSAPDAAPAGVPWSPSPDRSQDWPEVPAPDTSQAWTEPPSAGPADDPLVPPEYIENELRNAVGATPRAESKKKSKRRAPTSPVDDDEDDDGQPKRKNRKLVIVSALSVVMGCGIAALVFLGKANSAKYYISCEPERVVVEQGRSFPPWGTSTLDDAEWKPLKLPPEAACHPLETTDLTELALTYKKILVDQATALLTAREVTKVDDAEGALKQALLVSRSLSADDAKNARTDIDRLLGDVVYWRASARLKAASETLADAAKQFDAAAAQRPAHFTDAAEWAGYARTLIDQLRAGPGGVPSTAFPPLPPSERPTAPPGTALPVEPDQGSGSSEPPPPAPDAGVATGGVMI